MKQVIVTLGYRQQKCKAKWIKRMQTWQLHCPECDTYHVYVTERPMGPHDMAANHAKQHHDA